MSGVSTLSIILINGVGAVLFCGISLIIDKVFYKKSKLIDKPSLLIISVSLFSFWTTNDFYPNIFGKNETSTDKANGFLFSLLVSLIVTMLMFSIVKYWKNYQKRKSYRWILIKTLSGSFIFFKISDNKKPTYAKSVDWDGCDFLGPLM